jgi:hypothetical protein
MFLIIPGGGSYWLPPRLVLGYRSLVFFIMGRMTSPRLILRGFFLVHPCWIGTGIESRYRFKELSRYRFKELSRYRFKELVPMMTIFVSPRRGNR